MKILVPTMWLDSFRDKCLHDFAGDARLRSVMYSGSFM